MSQGPNPFDQQKSIPGVRRIIAVSSGKGGVGKSTVAVNLALALNQTGAKVGLLDSDIYGPSVPLMLGLSGEQPQVTPENHIIPIEKFGLKIMSIGFLVDDKSAIIWRGPRLFQVMDQFLRQVTWGELDYLVVDLPPGTGDVQLSLAQKVPVSGAVSVCTPQNVALLDVKRSIDMIQKVGVPLLGLVENMSYFIEPSSGKKLQLFPKGELEGFLDENRITKLAEIPFESEVAAAGDSGSPILLKNPASAASKAFLELAQKLRLRLAV